MIPERHYAMWMFTGACPSRCSYCDIASQQGRSGLTTSEVERVSREILEQRFLEVLFVGGEPLLSPDLPAALGILKGKIRTAVFTGGIPGFAEKAVKVLGDGAVDRIVLSIDSGDPAKNDEIRGRKGITAALLEMASLMKVRLPGMGRSLNTVVSRFNVDSLSGLWETMAPFEPESWALTLAGDSFGASPGHAFLDLDMLARLYFETIPDLAARTAKVGVELVVLPVPYPLLAARIPPIRWGEIGKSRSRVEVLSELERSSRGEHNATFVGKHGCPLVGIDVVIGVSGEVHPCSQAPIIDPRYVVGNIKSQSLGEVLSGEALGRFKAGVPHAPCTRCWAPSNVPREALMKLVTRSKTP